MTRAIGLDLGLSCTGYAVLEPGPKVIARGAIRPPTKYAEAQDKAHYITCEVYALFYRYGGRGFIEEPITNAWGTDAKSGQRVNKTNSTSAFAKGRLVGAVEDRLAYTRHQYDEVGIHRWRAILGLIARSKPEVIKELLETYFPANGIWMPDDTKADVIEAVGIGCAGLIAIAHPEVLLPGWKRPKPKTTKKKKASEAKPAAQDQGGLFDGNGNGA